MSCFSPRDVLKVRSRSQKKGITGRSHCFIFKLYSEDIVPNDGGPLWRCNVLCLFPLLTDELFSIAAFVNMTCLFSGT